MNFNQAQDFHEKIRNEINKKRELAKTYNDGDCAQADLFNAEARGMTFALSVFWRISNQKETA